MTPIAISSYSTPLESTGKQASTFIFNAITSTEYTPRKLTYSNSKETMTFHLGTLSSRYHMTEFRQPIQVQIHLEMPRILVQLGHIQRT